MALKEKLNKVFDFILIDVPSMAAASWSASVSAMADGVVLVIEAERTRWPVALNAKFEIENCGAKVLGAFLNKRRLYIPPIIYRYL